MDIILNRRSVRKFDLTKKISFDELYELCRYGESAPSARRQQGREYIIIDDAEVIKKLSGISKGALILNGCNSVIAVVAKNPELLTTPLMQPHDLSASVQNILLAATQKGYGSCWIGVHPIEDRVKACDEILKVKGGASIFALIALGYPMDEDCFYQMDKLDANMIHHNEY